MHMWIGKLDCWLDKTGEKLAKKNFTFPATMATALIFLVFAVVMCLIFPHQIEISDKDVVNGRSFPYLLMFMMMLSSAALLIGEIRKILQKKEVETKQINLLVEVKALIIFAILLLFYFLAKYVIFLVGAVVCAIGMLLFFRCKKPSYYLITVAMVVLIWAAFQYGLGVRF